MNPAEAYILNQPEPYKAILLHVQAVMGMTLPQLSLKYKYKTSFYYLYQKPFCYFNVNLKKRFADIGFVRGKQIQIHQSYLVAENRKQVTSLRYKTVEDIDNEVLIAVLKEAAGLYQK